MQPHASASENAVSKLEMKIRVYLGFRIWGLGFKVKGFGFRI